jgi:nucleoside-diphosphate-sugar epimerase
MVAEMESALSEIVLVTGGGGFVGGTVVEALHFLRGYTPKAGVHRWNSAARIARLPVEILRSDVMKPKQLMEAMSGADYVIHCAVGSDLNVIVEGTGNVLDAAVAAGVKRVVYTSSVAVYGGATGLIDESAVPPPGSLSPYGEAKRRSEDLCRAAAARGLQMVVLRPSLIYGPFSMLWTILYATRLKTGRWVDLGDAAQGKCNLVHVHDVARCAISALSGDDRAGQTFNISGPEVITWSEYFRGFNDRLGHPPLRPGSVSRARRMAKFTGPIRSTGKFALKNFKSQLTWLAQKSRPLSNLMKGTELTLRCTPNGDELQMYGSDITYDIRKAEAFGLRSKVTVSEGLDMTVAWLKYMDADEF